MSEPAVEPAEATQDQSPKRQRIAADTVQLAGRAYDGLRSLQALGQEAVQAGNYTQDDLINPAVSHLTPYMLQVFHSEAVVRLWECLKGPAYSGGPTVEEMLLQVRG